MDSVYFTTLSRIRRSALRPAFRVAPRLRNRGLGMEVALLDAMRGRFSTWTRIRVALRHVPEELRPTQGLLDPDEKILSSS
jgi:hypothetical protein